MNVSRSLFLFGFFLVLMTNVQGLWSAPAQQTLWVDDDDPTCGGRLPCYQTIQDAVAAAQPGDMIRIRPGTYTGPIEINKDLTLSGVSKELVFLREAASEGSGYWGIIRITQASVVKLEDVTILDGAVGVFIADQNAQAIINNTRFYKLIAAIAAADASDASSERGQLSLLHSEILASKVGVSIALSSSLPHQIEGNQFMDNSTAISVAGKGIVTVKNNELANNGIGIEIKGSAIATLQANVIQKNGSGVKVHEGAKVQLVGNTIMVNRSNGVIVRDSAQAMLINNVVTNNGLDSWPLYSGYPFDPLEYPGGFGIVVVDAAVVELVENLFKNNLFGFGLKITSTQLIPRLDAQRNQIVANGWGVWLQGGEAVLSNNEIIQNDFDVLGIDLYLYPLARLLLELFTPSGVLVLDGQPLLRSNHIMQNVFGVVLQGHSSPTLTSNQIGNNLRYGIALYQRPCFDVVAEFQGKVQGESNELLGNGQDLCPADYPWPPGFRK